MCRKYNLKRNENWYKHVPEGLIENAELKNFWDLLIQYDREIVERKADIVVMNKNEINFAIIYITIPEDIGVCKTVKGKIERYQ